MKKRILFTLTSLKIGGVQKSLVNILKNIDFNDYEVDFIVLEKNEDMVSDIPKKVNIYYLSDFIKDFRTPKQKGIIYRLNKNLKINSILKKQKFVFCKRKYDVAIAYDGFNNYADLITVACNAKKRIIFVHNDYLNMIKHSKFSFVKKIMYKKMKKKFLLFDQVICVSKSTMNNFIKLFYNVKIKVGYIYNLVDYSNIIKLSKQKPEIKLNGNFNLISIGRLCKAKNFEYLIEIHLKLLEKGLKIKTYIIGGGENQNKLNQIIKNKNITDTFILLGEQKNPYNILSQADLFLSTSLYETFGIALLEASILSVPWVSFGTSGANDLANDILKGRGYNIAKTREEYIEIIEEFYNNVKTPKLLHFDCSMHNRKNFEKFIQLL